jgi:DNA-binding NtrC family response regulator
MPTSALARRSILVFRMVTALLLQNLRMTSLGQAGQPIENRRTILLIDDEDSQRKFMRRTLREAGYRVLEGADYGEALAIHHQNQERIDLLITDISLPGQNGYELGKALLGIDPGLRVIFISGPVGAEICRFYKMDTTDVRFLEKPFTSADLLRRVRHMIDASGRAEAATAP